MMDRVMTMLEGTKLTAAGFIGAFLSIIAIRCVFEAFSSPSPNGFLPLDPHTVIHYGAYFLALYLIFSCIIGAFSGDYLRASKIMLFGLIVLWIPPVIDLIVTGGSGATLTYIMATPGELITLFFTFFGPLEGSGATFGIRIGLLLALIFIAWYVYRARKRITLAIGAAVSAYLALFILGSLPSVLYMISQVYGPYTEVTSVVGFLRLSLMDSGIAASALPGTLVPATELVRLETGFNAFMTASFSLISVVAGLWLALGIDKGGVIAHLKNARPLRVLHFLVLVALGAWGGVVLTGARIFAWPDALSLLCLIGAWCAASLFAICTNDLEDESIDRVSNTSRPLVTKALSREAMQDAAAFSVFFMLLLGWAAGYYAFFFILAFTAAYYAYSASPLRLKRVPILSSLIIGAAAVFAVATGFFFATGETTSGVFPSFAVLGVALFYGLIANFRDLKDIKGDAEAGIPTLVTMVAKRWGERAAFHTIGVLAAIAFLLTPVLFPVPHLIYAAVPIAALSYGACVVKPYREWLLFVSLFAFFAVSLVLLTYF